MAKRNSDIENIRHHVEVLNDEVGKLIIQVSLLKNDCKWIKWILATIAIPTVLIAIKFFLG